MLNLNKYKSVFFDCDGVILQSNKLKTQVFTEVLSSENSNLLEEFISYHKKNGGISRYHKFKFFYKNIKKDKDYAYKSDLAVKRYSIQVFKNLISIEYVPGFVEILNYFNKNDIPCYVISGGDEQELHKVFKKRNIFSRFQKILGSPKSKFDHAETLNNENLFKKPAILFGDSQLDMKIALKYGLDFCFIIQFSEWKFGKTIVEKFGYNNLYNFYDPLISFN